VADDLLSQLDAIPWFSKIGEPAPDDSGVERIYRWEEWPGPEEPSVLQLSIRQQALYDSIMGEAGGRRGDLSALWDRIHTAVFRATASAVPGDPQQDAWHAPTTAVWQAAWTAGLVGLCRQTGRPVPQDLQHQWAWFARGHWPCGYARQGADDKPGRLLVY
jgi:hypothetical protein